MTISGIEAYRAKYRQVFADFPHNHAELLNRIVVGARVIDHERVKRSPDAEPFEVAEDRIRADFAAAMAARAIPPQTFLLYLESGSAKLTTESEQLIPRIVEAIRTRTRPGVSIIGHTDTAGDAAANQRLGQERAQLIAQHLGLLPRDGAPARLSDVQLSDLTVTSHGESNLLVRTPDNTPEARNRRVEVTIR